jgi:hypothetical protein
MKGTVYGNRLPRGTQVKKKGWEPLTYGICCARGGLTAGGVNHAGQALKVVLGPPDFRLGVRVTTYLIKNNYFIGVSGQIITGKPYL